MMTSGVLFARIPCGTWYGLGLVGCCADISGTWKVAIKKPLADLCLAIGAWYSPFKLDTVDQVWPENFGGVYKAPAVDLVSGGYMLVQ
jgi:hypothetical protein